MSAIRDHVRFFFVGTILLITFSAAIVWGQATWGAISGFVTDDTGSAVPNAKVSIANEKTGVKTDGMADNAGLYNVTHLDPGVYTVTVEASGFRRFVQQHVVLRVDSTVRVDPKLEVGEVSQQVTVVASAEEFKTEKTDVDRVISQDELDNIPLPNHNLTQLYLTTPGVSTPPFRLAITKTRLRDR